MAAKSQVQRILDKLVDGQYHCTSEFYADYMADPRARMQDLKRKGYTLESRPCQKHSYHDGPTKEWKLTYDPQKKTSTAKYIYKVINGVPYKLKVA